MASVRGLRKSLSQTGASPRDRWRRWILLIQGVYYMVTGLWPLLHFSSFSAVVRIQIVPFQAHAFAAVILVVGGLLIEAARREPPGPFPTLLGLTVAAAIAVVSLFWLPRLNLLSGLWIDLVVEVAIAIALVVFYPRPEPERGRTSSRRR